MYHLPAAQLASANNQKDAPHSQHPQHQQPQQPLPLPPPGFWPHQPGAMPPPVSGSMPPPPMPPPSSGQLPDGLRNMSEDELRMAMLSLLPEGQMNAVHWGWVQALAAALQG